ncbi:hypothetical protein [Paenibacillus peoriae]|uniref:hypothetical protein n=1 Tax=Paenibacillus peoriae TaxID=59893 RepID=UPI00215A2276|nr:hypothetical protein [Paenibacillus peoriae]
MAHTTGSKAASTSALEPVRTAGPLLTPGESAPVKALYVPVVHYRYNTGSTTEKITPGCP